MHDRAIRAYKQSLRIRCIKEGKLYHDSCWSYVNLELTIAVADSTFLNKIDPVVH
jgi:hypothetical protein